MHNPFQTPTFWRLFRAAFLLASLLVVCLSIARFQPRAATAQSAPNNHAHYLPVVENSEQPIFGSQLLHGLLRVSVRNSITSIALIDPWDTTYNIAQSSAIDWQKFDGQYVTIEGTWQTHRQATFVAVDIRTLAEDGERYRAYVGQEMSNPAAVSIRDSARSAKLQAAKLIANPAQVGEWSAVQEIGLYALHAVLRPDGKVLFWYRTVITNPSDPSFNTLLWDPETNAVTPVSNNSAQGEENWCASHTQLGDGQLLAVTGEVGAPDAHTTLFDPLRNVWTPQADLNFGRYYPSATYMGDGRTVVSGGDFITPDTNTVPNPFPEVWENGAWRSFADPLEITPTPTEFDFYYGSFFPWTQQAPNGQVFYAGPQDNLRFLDPNGIGTVIEAGQRDGHSRDYGSYATYDIGKVLIAGGGASLATAYTIDYNRATPSVAQTGSMTHGRRHLYTTILADGTVLATGGNGDGGIAQASPNGAVFAAELWDPETGVWTELAEMERRREYHSSAILLPDGRVVHAGGDCTPCAPESNLEIFSPPYLFNADGSAATRPVINAIERVQTGISLSLTNQPEFDYGERLAINFGAANAIDKVHLIRLGSSTHATNFDQRLVPLNFTSSGNDLHVVAPQNTYTAPPGYYMLFVVSDAGVPSVATMIKLGTHIQKLEHVLNFRDGGFEESYSPPVGAWFMYVAGDTFGGWTVDYGNVDVQHNANSGAGIGSYGEQQVDLNGTEPGKISQQLSGLIPGQAYEIRFNYASHKLAALAEATVQIADLNQTWQTTNAHDEPWHTASYTFTASSGTHTLSFAGGGPLTYAGMLIDNIRVSLYSPPLPSGRPPINLALNQPATQSSQSAGQPAIAVDGNTSGDGTQDQITRTTNQRNPWWQVDLGQSQPIDQVVLWNQTDCCTDQLRDFYIFISDTDLTGQSFTNILNDPTIDRIYSAGVFSNTDPISITKKIDSSGQYVRVQSAIDGELRLAEVQVFSPPQPNQIPVISAPTAQTNNVNDAVALTLSATDAENDPLTYSATNLPADLTLDQNTGLISGTITTASVYTITVTAADPYDSSAPATFTWTVNGPPSISSPGDQFSTIGDTVNLTISTSDDDSSSLIYSATNLPADLMLDPNSGLISGTITAAGTYTVSLLVTDANNNSDSATFIWQVNNPPTISTPANQTSIISDTISLQINATDADGDTLTYSAGSLPPALAINPTTGLIIGTVSTAGTYAVFIVVSDGNGSNTTAEFNWIVSYPPNEPPTVNAPTDQYHTVGQAIQLPITAASPESDPLTFSVANLPGGLTINPATGLISGTAISPGTYPVTVTVSDSNNGSASTNFTWEINGLPDITFPGDQTSTVGDPAALTITATDSENEGMIFSATNLPSGLAIDPTSGQLTGTLQAAGIFDVTVTVDDGRGGISTVTLVWTVTEAANTPPQLTQVADQTNRIGDSVQLQIAATDSDTDPLTFSVENLPAGLSINPTTGTISGTVTTIDTHTVILTTNDGRGGTDSISFTWFIDAPQNQPPRISNPGPQENTVGETVSLRLIAIDADGDELSYNLASLPAGLTHNDQTGIISGTVEKAGLYEVQFTVYDGQGGSDGVTFGWTVQPKPNNTPKIQPIADQAHQVGDSVALSITATDADGDPLQFSVANLPEGLTFSPLGTAPETVTSSQTGFVSGTAEEAGAYDVQITIDDGQGGSDSYSFKWTVAPSPNQPPSVESILDQANEVSDTILLPIEATDPDGDLLQFSIAGLPFGLAFDPAMGYISGTLTTAGIYTTSISVDDGATDPVATVFVWSVAESDLTQTGTLTPPATQENRVGDTISLPLDAVYSADATVTFAADGLPAGLDIHPKSGMITGAPTQIGEYVVTITIQQQNDAPEAAMFRWIVTESAAQEIRYYLPFTTKIN